MLKSEYTVAKLKNQASQASSKYFVSAWQLVTYLIGICNADSGQWFLLFEDAEGSLQVNKTSKKHQNLNVKQ